MIPITIEEKMERVRERITAVETSVSGKGGVLDRMDHLDKCVDSLKRTVWMAAGAITIIGIFANVLISIIK